jgi:hypothetical protein
MTFGRGEEGLCDCGSKRSHDSLRRREYDRTLPPPQRSQPVGRNTPHNFLRRCRELSAVVETYFDALFEPLLIRVRSRWRAIRYRA